MNLQDLLQDLQFKPMEFIHNLGYMGFGMLGIFAVICLIALITAMLNKIFSSDKNGEEK